MVDKILGTTICAHCQRADADDTCMSCRAAVCSLCAADWTTCSEPVGREVLLGWRARLTQVDPSGRLGIVGGWLRSPRVLALRRMRWVNARLGDTGLGRGQRHQQPLLMPDGRVLYVRAELVDSGDTTQWAYQGLDMVGLSGHIEASYELHPEPRKLWVAPAGKLIWTATTDERVQILWPSSPPATALCDPLPGRVLQAVHCDPACERLAAATWGEVAVFQLRGSELVSVDHGEFDGGDVAWVRVSHSRLGVLAVHKRRYTLLVWSFANGTIRNVKPIRFDYEDGAQPHASMSPDGRYVAVAQRDHQLVVHDLQQQRTVYMRGHTDEICYVSFVDNGRQLVTADCDSRVIVRPRTSHGYAEVTQPIKLENRPLSVRQLLADRSKQ